MIEGKTKSGFNFKLEDDAIDDMELLEGLIALENGNYKRLPETITALLGENQKTKLYDHCRSKKTGRVSAAKVMAAVGEMFKAVQDSSSKVKN